MNKETNKRTIDLKRLSSALLLFPLVIIVLVFGNKYIVDIVASVIAIIAMYEYIQAVSKKSNPVKWLCFLSCIAISVIHIIPEEYVGMVGFLTIPAILFILFLQIVITNMKTNFNDIVYTFLGIMYIPFCMMSIALVKGINNGSVLVWYIIGTGWGTDVFAYWVGKNFGKHKFSKVSPKKSIEGCIAGVVGVEISMLIFTYAMNTFFGMQFSYVNAAIICGILSIIGQVGDFAASSIKRYVEIKDFSELIPGHGGMLDRIDSLLFIAPFAYILLRFM